MCSGCLHAKPPVKRKQTEHVFSINIHFQLIIITNVSILTDLAYFVPPSCHCGILALRLRDLKWPRTIRATVPQLVPDALILSLKRRIKHYAALYVLRFIATFHTNWHITPMKSGARTIKHIYFVSLDIYLHSPILTYLLIFISSLLS
jgi:hypothetical protein